MFFVFYKKKMGQKVNVKDNFKVNVVHYLNEKATTSILISNQMLIPQGFQKEWRFCHADHILFVEYYFVKLEHLIAG